MAINPKNTLRTWIEIDKKAIFHNINEFRKIINPDIKLMAVIKSNAYGHGIVDFAKTVENKVDWFGVDSIIEGLKLRQKGIKNPILVLGYTLPSRVEDAARSDISLTVSSFELLEQIIKLKDRPKIHLKIDTGMHRQGFLPGDIFKLIKLLKRFSLTPQGVYTHFASKDWGYPVYTEEQFSKFNQVLEVFRRAGFKNFIRHAAASDAALLFPKMYLDMVRVGMGLYGYWPSWVAKVKHPPQVSLKPVLGWKTIVGEVKEIPVGSYVGYDLTERVSRKTKLAILPIGYWHGYDRGLSSIGEVLVRGRRAKILGRVSMDITVVDVTGIPKVKVGDPAVLIGKQNGGEVWADELALKIGTSQYEFLTRINPLIKRIYI